jgi:stage II sporulation protein E
VVETGNQGVFVNPYVVQMDKFADSLKHLASIFLSLEKYKGTLSKDEMDEMYKRVTDRVCSGCENRAVCLEEKRADTGQMLYEILGAVEEYGAELNVELKRKLKKRCLFAPRFLRETLESYEAAKQVLMWNWKMAKSREGYAASMNQFASVIQSTTRELDAGIFEDEHLEKKLKSRLKKAGVKMLSAVFYMTPQGKYEIHLTLKAEKGYMIATGDLVQIIGECAGRRMMPRQGERLFIGEEYSTIACVESARFQTLQGVAKIGKGCEHISGDTFLMTDLPGGKKGIALSDGMGSGQEAFRESAMVVELLEELLMTGFPVETAIQMLNTALVVGREEVRFSTIDVCVFDLYEGACEFVKAGACTTFIKQADLVEQISSTTLPIGVVQEIELEVTKRNLQSGDYVIMVTDGVMDALPIGEQEKLISTFIQESKIVNPKELAHHILGRVLEQSGEVPVDDMTVLVTGLWKI